MVKIKKGKLRTEVAKSAFKNFYESSGWVIDDGVDVKEPEVVEEVVKVEEEPETFEEDNKDEWPEDWSDEEVEKPLSEMNIDELRIKASSLGINTSGLNAKQIRQKIRNHS